MRIVWLPSTGSTNAYIREKGDAVEPMTMVCALEQTAGRGQRGNSWESEPFRNLTFSFKIGNPAVKPACQFAISEAVALAMARVLADYGIEAKVKWPNDIYAGNEKIAGILIENAIMGSSIVHSIVGIGLNVNQREFLSDAPNPVSMANITGQDYPLEEVATKVAERLEEYAARLGVDEGLPREYLERLWRHDGEWHPFRDCASGREFKGMIRDVELSGHLVLQTEDSALRRYAFKEVAFL